MHPKLIRTSLSNSVYFSFITFIIIWLAGILYEGLEKTTGRLNLGAVIIIVLSLILVLFFLAVINLLLSEPDRARISFKDRTVSMLLFILTSAIILVVLGFLFWFKI